MLWIEGESTAWTPVSELELHSHQAPSPVNHTLKGIERNAEESRLKGAHPGLHQPKVYIEKPGEPVPASAYSEEDAIVLVDHRKEKKNILYELVMTTVVVALFAGGIYGSRTLFAAKKEVVSAAPARLISNDENAAKPMTSVTLTGERPDPAQHDTLASSTAPVITVSRKTTVRRNGDSAGVVANTPAQTLPAPDAVQKNESATVAVSAQEQPQVKKEKKETAAVPDKSDESSGLKAEEPEKKKGFFRNLFKKKKKDNSKEDKDDQ